MVVSRRAGNRGTVRSFERPPVILEWGSWMIRLGYTEQGLPKHFIPLPDDVMGVDNKQRSCPQEWYLKVIAPLLQTCFDRLLSRPRRVIVVHPPYMPRAWEEALQKGLWNNGVSGIAFLQNVDTPPLALEWQRGMVIHVDGKRDTYCMAHADGQALQNSLQIATTTTTTPASDASKIPELSHDVIVCIANCLQACPLDVRQDVAANLVVCGEAVVVQPDLPYKIVERLQTMFSSGEAPEDASGGEQTNYPTKWKELSSLKPVARTTGPYRPDMVSWIGASLYAAVWHRHDDDDQNAVVQWRYAPPA